MVSTKAKDTVPFHTRAMPRNAQKNHKLLDNETLPATVIHALRVHWDTGRERCRLGKTAWCSTNALAVSNATSTSLAWSFGLSR